MRIAAVQMHDGEKLVVDVDDDHRRLEFDGDLLALIQGGVDPHELTVRAAVEGERTAPLQPGKIVGIGLDYLDHIRESKLPQPSQPLVFAKFPSSVTGPNDPIVVDVELTAHVGWKVELGVVVGRRMRRVAVGAALDYVFGYTVCNDVSARRSARVTSRWSRAT
jgi:2-keto-4-pentenoate hydratase/2-oxohepta-3-ene-1,7-dioic acid hydratase in catechol pathway